MWQERTLGEKFLAVMTLIMTTVFIIICVTFAICTYKEKYEDYGFDDDIDVMDSTDSMNISRSVTGHFNHGKIISALMRIEDDREHFLCNANMISKNWFVTTAHCLKIIEVHELTSNLTVRTSVGDYRDFGIDRKVEKIITHPYYNRDDLANNIGLVKVYDKPDIGYGKYPYEFINGRNYPYMKNDVINVHGWGKSSYNDDVEDAKLKAVQFNVIDKEDCESITNNITELSKNQLCGNHFDPDGEECYPSEGAGVIKNGQLIALSSWGERCIEKGVPHIFTQMNEYLPWILGYVLDE